MILLSRRWPFVLAVAVLATDFITKRFVLAHVGTFAQGIPLIHGVLRFTYVRNSGAAFGLFQGARWPFILVSLGAIVLLWGVLSRGRSPRLRAIAYALILAGAAGNLVDRLFYGGRVVDFIEMGLRGHTFPVYNVADMGVSIGATLLVLGMLLEGRGAPRTGGVPQPGTNSVGAVGAVGGAAAVAPAHPARDELSQPGHP
jgi:signal peptidase II